MLHHQQAMMNPHRRLATTTTIATTSAHHRHRRHSMLLNRTKPKHQDPTRMDATGGHSRRHSVAINLLLLFCCFCCLSLSPGLSLILTASPSSSSALVGGVGGVGGGGLVDLAIRRGDMIEPASRTNTSAIQRVTNLRLSPDFRSLKLTWTLAHQEPSQRPASFDVRLCELTSWNFEIKCRHKQLKVSADTNSVISTHGYGAAKVPRSKPEEALELEPGVFEAQLHDLRALTNYTVQVEPSSWSQQPPPHLDRARSWAGRAMPLWGSNNNNNNNMINRQPIGEQPLSVHVAETKPFEAELTKCLGNSTEVLVQTGRFFGGRISVENAPDSQCQLLGNRSSEQTSYLFRVDHKLCGSKLLDASRMESVILVQENKDILTHNTARFLAHCSFDHNKSFVIKASVALPKVATSLAARVQPEMGQQQHHHFRPATVVRLGSMPGVYRSRQSGPMDADLDSNAIDRSSVGSNRRSKELDAMDSSPAMHQLHHRRPIEFVQSRSNPEVVSPSAPTSRSLTFNGQLVAPQPVQVQSGVLFVERRPAEGDVSSARVGRAHHLATGEEFRTQVRTVGSVERVVRPPTLAPPSHSTPSPPHRTDKDSSSTNNTHSEVQQVKAIHDLRSPPGRLPKEPPVEAKLTADDETGLVLTNNHRVETDIPNFGPSSDHGDDNDDSPAGSAPVIKYSAARFRPSVFFDTELEQPRSPGRRNHRTGRMRSITGSPELGSSSRRWGELDSALDGDHLIGSESSTSTSWSNQRPNTADRHLTSPNLNDDPTSEVVEPSLAHNITSHLLRWSLKTLGNIAKKSLESIARNAANLTDEEDEHHPTLLVDPQHIEALTTTMAQTNHLSSPDHNANNNKTRSTKQLQSRQVDSSSVNRNPVAHSNQATSTRLTDQLGAKMGVESRSSGGTSEQVFSGRSSSSTSGQWSSYVGCALYGLVFLVGSIVVLLLTFWLVAPSRRAAADDCGGCSSRLPTDGTTNDPRRPHLAGLLAAAGVAQQPRDPTVNSPDPMGPARNKSSLSNKSASSRCSTNRSTSTDLTGIGGEMDQSDCKNNELFYTEHVLIDTGSRAGESYA